LNNIGVLISGSGSNLQALIDHQHEFQGKIACVISNVSTAYGIERANKAGIPAFTVDHGQFSSRELFETELIRILDDNNVDLIVLAGFMRILTPLFLDHYPNAVINVHPALLPSFPGINAQQQALKYGVKVAGVTVHFVDSGVDSGPIILQAAVSIDPVNEDITIIRERILEQEHVILPEAVRLFCENKLRINGHKVEILHSNRQR